MEGGQRMNRGKEGKYKGREMKGGMNREEKQEGWEREKAGGQRTEMEGREGMWK